MTVIQVRTTDNTTKKISDIGDLSKIANVPIDEIKLDKKNLLLFPQDFCGGISKNYSKYPAIFNYYNCELRTNNVMGFIGCGKAKLTISSRFYSHGNDHFLHYMLRKVLGINLVNLNFATDKENEDIHDFLPYFFPSYLQNALSQGLFKQYKRNQYNDANIRGAIDVNRHIKINIPFSGKIAYTTKEHSYDNSITQLIRHTIEYLRTRAFGHSILTGNADVRVYVSQIEYATPTYKKGDLQKVIRANLQPMNHPYFTEYRELQKLCLMILQKEKTSFGKKDEIYGLLFDGAWLWEEYIATVLKNKKIEHRIYGVTKKDYLFKSGQLITPDFIKLKNTGGVSFIGDTKYKFIDTKRSKREDYYQIITYMFRYSCKKGYIIFPFNKDEDSEFLEGKEREINNNTGYKVVELGVRIPQKTSSFRDFSETIKKYEKLLLKKIK
jgi:5-methylcytosine-specific restriction endonuclease McrBC regulatory subunit McrC